MSCPEILFRAEIRWFVSALLLPKLSAGRPHEDGNAHPLASRDARRSPCGAPPCARRERRPQPTAHGTGTDRGRRDGEPICCHCTAGIPQLHSCARLCAAADTPAAAAGPEGIGFLLAARAHARGDASAARRPRAVGKKRRHRGCQRPSHRVLRPAVVAQGAGDPVQALGGLKRAAREEAWVCGRAQGLAATHHGRVGRCQRGRCRA